MEIVQYLKPVAESGSAGSEVFSNLGFAYSQLNRLDEARYCYKQWLELEPNRAQPHYCLGYIDYMEKEWKEAIEWFDQALEIFPDYMVCLYRKGVAQFNMLKSKTALETFTRAIKVYQASENPQFMKTQAKYFYKSIFYLGKCYYDLHKFNHSIACFKKIIAEDQRDYVDPLFKNYNLAKGFYGLKQYPEAIAILLELHKKFPQREYIDDLLGQVYAASGDYYRANEYYKQALKKRPAFYIFSHRADLHFNNGKLSEAIRDYHEALKRDRKGKHKILLALGKTAIAQNQPEQAKTYFIRAIEFKKKLYESDYADAHLALAEYYKLTGNDNEAKAEYAIAAELMDSWD